MNINCPQCGEPTGRLHGGYCFECYETNQRALDLHNAEFDAWERLSDKERSDSIRRAYT